MIGWWWAARLVALMNSCPIQVTYSSAIVAHVLVHSKLKWLLIHNHYRTIIAFIWKCPVRGMHATAYSLALELTTGNCLSLIPIYSLKRRLNSNGTFSFICYNNVILLQSQPLRTLPALQSKSAFCSRPSRHVSHIAFLLDSWSSVRKFTNPTESSD